MSISLSWIKCQGDVWCPLSTVDLNHAHFNNMEGVYVIWHGGPTPTVVYVGQGNIRQRLQEHRTNPEIQKYAGLGLFVTWARVEQQFRNGVERFLIDQLHPLANIKVPDELPTTVNLPWQT